MTFDLNISAIAQGATLLLMGAAANWLRGVAGRIRKIERQIGNGDKPLSERMAIIETRVEGMHKDNSSRLDGLSKAVSRRNTR